MEYNWDSAKPSNTNKIQIQIIYKASKRLKLYTTFMSQMTLHKDLSISIVQNVAKTIYK